MAVSRCDSGANVTVPCRSLMGSLAYLWKPHARTCFPCLGTAFSTLHSRQEPYAVSLRVRVCAGEDCKAGPFRPRNKGGQATRFAATGYSVFSTPAEFLAKHAWGQSLMRAEIACEMRTVRETALQSDLRDGQTGLCQHERHSFATAPPDFVQNGKAQRFSEPLF